jgi:polysaccharide biosynthesis/export protein
MNRRSFLLLAPSLAAALALAACTRPILVDSLDETSSTPYTLGSGDRLRIIVFGQDTLSNLYPVDGAGRISMPLIGSVKVADLTNAQAASVIESRLRSGFLREPKVTVEIESYRPFFILGEVTNSGQFSYVNGMNVQKAVAIAGGFNPRAARTHADITRTINGVPVTFRVPLSHIVRPGDAVTIRERWL